MDRFTKQKDLGNNEFKNKNFSKALQLFQSTINEIEAIQSKQYQVPTTQLGKLYVILLINAAFACISLKQKLQYQKAIQLSTKALAVDGKNVKGLFRRGVACKQLAEMLERQNSSNYTGLIELYTKAKEDFENVNILQKFNELALEKFKETVKDIYRVTKAQGQQINLSSKPNGKDPEQKSIQQKIAKSNPYEGNTNNKKKGLDMEKIMEQYKVNQVSNLVQKKVCDGYLNGPLPQTRSQLQKALREIQKSTDAFCQLIYRFDVDYLAKVQPTFDMLSQMIVVILKEGKDQNGKKALQTLKSCKSFNLYWKSLIKREKQQFAKKWTEMGLNPEELQ